MDDKRWGYIDAMMSRAEDFSDGAFWGFMQVECGIDADELIEYERIRDSREQPAANETEPQPTKGE